MMSTNTNEEQLKTTIAEENTQGDVTPVVEETATSTVETVAEVSTATESVKDEGVKEANTVPSPLGQKTNQVFQTPPSAPAVKKPRKIGWIIPLVFWIISLVGVSIGASMFIGGITTIEADIKSAGKNQKPTQNAGAGKLKVLSLEEGKQYIISLEQSDGPAVTGVTVDGNNLGNPIDLTLNGEKSGKLFVFTASGKTASLELQGIDETSRGTISVIDGGTIISKVINIGIGGILMFVAGVIAFISFLLFAIFLILFLVKNSKYKQTRQTA